MRAMSPRFSPQVEEAEILASTFRCGFCSGRAEVIGHRVVTVHHKDCIGHRALLARHPTISWLSRKIRP